MKTLYFFALFIFGPCWAVCEPKDAVNFQHGANTSQVWATYWCKPTARWMDYTPDWGVANVSANILPALSTGKASELRKLVSYTTPPDFVLAQLKATQPPAPVVVAKNGTTLTRPTFVVIKDTGLRNSAPYTIRATVGARAACNVLMISEGASTYCAWEREGGVYTNIVTLVSEVK